jgi:hypothetical protein
VSQALLHHIITGLRRYWSDRTALVLLDDDGRIGRPYINEIHSCGGHVGGVLIREPVGALLGLPVERVWSCADNGFRFSRPQFEMWLADPPDSVQQWLDELDPTAEWTVLGTPHTWVAEFCGRPLHGFRRAEWATLEDKTVIDTLWERIGVRSPKYRIVDVADLVGARCYADAVGCPDLPFGVVIAADSSSGQLDGCTGLRWARHPAQFGQGLSALAAISLKVRIAEFVPGIPCSILGMVTSDGVAVFPPLEIVTLGSVAGSLRFCGTSTHWRPDGSAVTEMVRACRTAGEELARVMSYAGIFSVDGILGNNGFFATELNPRHASGLDTGPGCPELPILLFNRAVQERLPGFERVSREDIEMLISSALIAAPSVSVTIPSDMSATVGRHVVQTSFGPVEYEGAGAKARITRVPSVSGDGRIGPMCAELSRFLDGPGWFCFPEGLALLST